MKAGCNYVFAGLLVVLTAACGGGGSDSVVVVPPVQLDPVQISAANAPSVTSASLNAAAFGGELGDLGGTGVLGVPAAPDTLSKVAAVGFSKTFGTTVNATEGPVTIPCNFDGFITLTITYTDLNTVTAGDRITSTFDQCDDGDGIVMDGYMDLLFTSFSGNVDTGLFNAIIAVTLGNLSMDEGDPAGPVVADGEFQIATNTLSYPIVTTTVSGELVELQGNGKTLTMEDFSTTTVSDDSTLGYSITASGLVSGNEFEGVADYETVEAFVGTGMENPYAGEMLITGADNSSIRVTVLGVDSVLLEMDYDGDGAVDESIELTWDEAIS